MSQFHLVYPVK
ncbi:unnamed protein product [Callosobruchus maculatus]|uniref:Uncharacterized protein n=1 Tax=Callosobruchus maculatus TaxID=64391 RepID=A0A653BJG8_CALMS|nr:unnamed protein product [Callosobruchus maculatus]